MPGAQKMSENGFPFERYLSSGEKKLPQEILSKINNNKSLKEIRLHTTKEKIDKKSDSDYNEALHNALKSCVPLMKYEEYFKNQIQYKSHDDEQAYLEAADAQAKSVILMQFYDQLCHSLEIATGEKLIPSVEVSQNSRPKKASEAKFTLDLNTSLDESANKADSAYLKHMNAQETDIIIDPNKTFQSFIVGPSNNMAYSAAKAVAKDPGNRGSYPTLYIYSGSGLGKTHLLHAVANEIKINYPDLVICLISTKEFISEMISAMQNNSMPAFMRRYTERVDLLMIDDIHEIKNKETTQDLIFDIFNMLHKKGKQLIFTSDIEPAKIDGISERLKTRLGWGLVIDIQKPDLETRIAILKRKASEIDLYLTDDILNLIAFSIRSSIRELEGALIKLHAYFRMMKIDLDLELVKRYLNLEAPEDHKEITLDTIAKATSQYFRITVADLKSKTRKKEVITARHVAMYLSRKIVSSTLEEIGSFYGGRHYSSVIHAEQSVTEKLQKEPGLSKDILYIENNL
jgi:chromosomal replication initiator protein